MIWALPLLLATGLQAKCYIFVSLDCPISNAYQPEINRMVDAFKGVEFDQIVEGEEWTQDKVDQHAKEFEIKSKIDLDLDQKLLHLYKPKVTPTAVVIDKAGKVIYKGRIDDTYPRLGMHRPSANHHDLQDILSAVQLGLKVKPKQTEAIGCLISGA